jgi:hypothetical protein
MGVVIQQRLDDEWERCPQAPSVIARNSACIPPSLHIPGEHAHHVTEGQIGISQAGVGAAIAHCDQKVAMGRHRPLGKGLQQRGFAPAWTAGYEYHLALSGQCPIEEDIQSRQLVLSSDKERSLERVSCLFLGQKGG